MKKLMLMTTLALCLTPMAKPSFFSKGVGTAFQALKNNKLNSLCAGGVGYQLFTENANDAKINILAQGLINTQAKNNLLAQELINVQNNSISKTTFWTVATFLGFGCYIAIRAAYNNMLLNRPKIGTIIRSAKNPQEAIHQLKKHSYKKEDLAALNKILSGKFTDAEIAIIESQLS